MQRIIISFSLILLLIGLLWPSLTKLPFGRLPGDITIRGENYTFTFPLMTCLVVSALLSLLVGCLRRFGP